MVFTLLQGTLTSPIWRLYSRSYTSMLNSLQGGRTLWIMFTPTSSMPTEPYPSPTSASQTIFPSCFPQPTPPSDALFKLQDCFKQTDWDLFVHQELETFTGTVLDYIKFCIGNVTVDKNIRAFPNQKPWMISQVRTLLRARNAAFKSGDRALYRAARANLKRGIKRTKVDHRMRIESHLSSNNSREVWQGIQYITNFRGCDASTEALSAPLAEELNCFFARFETSQHHSSAPALPPPFAPLHSLCMSTMLDGCFWQWTPRKLPAPRRSTWQSAQSVRLPACPHLYQDLQPLAGPGSYPVVPKISYNNPSAEEVSHHQPERLPSGGPYSGNHEVHWETGPSAHQGSSPPRLRPLPVRISCEQIHRGRHFLSSPLCAEPPGEAAEICLNALCGLQFSFQYRNPGQTYHQTGHSWPSSSYMCLDKGLFNQPTPDCETWPSPLLHPHAENRLPTGLCAEPPPVLPLHPRLQSGPQWQTHRQVCRRHYSGRTHLQGWGGSPQRRGPEVGSLVYRE